MGVDGSRKRRKPVGWLRDTVNGFYTSDMVKDDFMAMEPKDRFMARVALEPKHNINENSDLKVIIQLTGIKGKQPIQVKEIEQKSLGMGRQGDDSEDG